MTRREFNKATKYLKDQEPAEGKEKGVFINRIPSPRYTVVNHDKRGRRWKKKAVLKEVWPWVKVEGKPAANPEYVSAPFEMTVWYLKNVYTVAVQKRMNAKLRVIGKEKA